MTNRLIASFVCLTFILNTCPPVFAQGLNVIDLPAAGTMVSLSPNFQPALIKGLTVHQDNPFLFDFIVDPGQSHLSGQALKDESERMIKYFFASLTIPNQDIWVNLSPYEKDRMIPHTLGETAMGRDLLAQDYFLKQLTASLIYPQKELGKEFWSRVYAKAKEMYGTSEIPVNTFNKVWIMPESSAVYEHDQTAFVVEGHLKVMLEEDYLSLAKHNAISNSDLSARLRQSFPVHSISSQIIKQVILPEIEKEVNDGRNFSTLRQILYAQILAVWFKQNLKQALLSRVYANKSTVKGIDQNDLSTNERIYQQYLKAYKKGVFNFIHEDMDPITKATMPRKYFSGGWTSKAMVVKTYKSPSQLPARALSTLTAAENLSVLTDVFVAVATSYKEGVALANAAMVSGSQTPRGAAEYLRSFGLPVLATRNPQIITIAGRTVDLRKPKALADAFNKELEPIEAGPVDQAMPADILQFLTPYYGILGVHFAGMGVLATGIVKSTKEFNAGKKAAAIEEKIKYYNLFLNDFLHIAGAGAIALTGVILSDMNGVNIESIKPDLLGLLTGSKIGGGIFGFERFAKELVAAANKAKVSHDKYLIAVKQEKGGNKDIIAAANAQYEQDMQALSELENFTGNPWRKFFFKYTDWPVFVSLFAIALVNFPTSWDPTFLHQFVEFVKDKHFYLHPEWAFPGLPILAGVFGIGAPLAKFLDKRRTVHPIDAAMLSNTMLSLGFKALHEYFIDGTVKAGDRVNVYGKYTGTYWGAKLVDVDEGKITFEIDYKALTLTKESVGAIDLILPNDIKLPVMDKKLNPVVSQLIRTLEKLNAQNIDIQQNRDGRYLPTELEAEIAVFNRALSQASLLPNYLDKLLKILNGNPSIEKEILREYLNINSLEVEFSGLVGLYKQTKYGIPGLAETLKKGQIKYPRGILNNISDQKIQIIVFPETILLLKLASLVNHVDEAMVGVDLGKFESKGKQNTLRYTIGEAKQYLVLPSQLTNPAMNVLIPKGIMGQTSTSSLNGGIDLSQQDTLMRVTKDANGGVKVDVDPALIVHVERNGLSELDPVIIGMRPADMRSLFVVKV